MNNGFDIRDGILYKYSGNAVNIVIPDSVCIIHEKAFRYNSTIVSVEIPSSVTRIEWAHSHFVRNWNGL